MGFKCKVLNFNSTIFSHILASSMYPQYSASYEPEVPSPPGEEQPPLPSPINEQPPLPPSINEQPPLPPSTNEQPPLPPSANEQSLTTNKKCLSLNEKTQLSLINICENEVEEVGKPKNKNASSCSFGTRSSKLFVGGQTDIEVFN